MVLFFVTCNAGKKAVKTVKSVTKGPHLKKNSLKKNNVKKSDLYCDSSFFTSPKKSTLLHPCLKNMGYLKLESSTADDNQSFYITSPKDDMKDLILDIGKYIMAPKRFFIVKSDVENLKEDLPKTGTIFDQSRPLSILEGALKLGKEAKRKKISPHKKRA